MLLRRFWPLTALILAAIAAPLALSSRTFVPPADAADSIVFQGHVYVMDSTTPIPGSTVALWQRGNGRGDLWQYVTTATAGWDGLFTLRITYSPLTNYQLRESNLPSYTSVVASFPPDWTFATVVDADTITLDDAGLSPGAWTGIRFFDRPSPTSTPTVTQFPTPTSTPTGLQTIELCAQADTTVIEQSPTFTYWSDTLLALGNAPVLGPTGDRRRILMRFQWPALPAGATVYAASLTLRLVGATGDSSASVSVFPVITPWEETTATWNNQPYISASLPGPAAVGLSSPTLVTWNVTSLAQQWVNGTLANNGLELRGPETGTWLRGFDSEDQPGGYCPRLIITLQASNPVPTLTPTTTPTRTRTATRTPTPTATTYCLAEFLVGDGFSDAADFVHLNMASPFQEYICPAGDQDWFRFPAQIGQTITVRLDDLPNDYWVSLYRPDGSWANDSASSDYNEAISFVADQNGDWRVSVRGRQGTSWSNTTRYSLWVSVCATEDESSQAEPAMITLGQLKTGYICPCGDEDWYTIQIPYAQAVYVDAWLGSQSPDYELHVYSPDGLGRGSSVTAGVINKTVHAPADNLPGLWKIKVKPRNNTDCSSISPYQLQVTLSTDLDLTIKWLEVTQVVQNLFSNDISLVAGKPTIARVYIDVGDAAVPIENVAVELTGSWYCVGCTPLSGSPLYLGSHTVTKRSTQAQRLDPNSFNVLLPDSWLRPGTLYLTARVYAQSPQQPEQHTSNNTSSEIVFVVQRAPVNLAIVPITASGLTPAVTGNSNLDTIVSFMQDSYPTSYIQLWLPVPGLGLSANYDYTVKGTSGCGPSWGKLLDDLDYLYAHIKGPPAGFLMYGIMDPAVPHHWAGCGSYTSRVSAGILATGDDNLAHEAGHMLGLPHAPCGGPQNPDLAFPTYVNPLGGTFPASSIGEVGVRLNGGLTLFDPSQAKDVMSYCWPKWFSPYNYNKLMGAIPAASLPVQASASESPHLIAIGQVTEGHVELTSPLWVEPMPVDSASSGEGPYRIEVQDGRGAVLAACDFDPSDPYHDTTPDSGRFSEILPYPEGAARVVFLRGGIAQLTVTPSAHAPTVAITSPTGGEVWAASGTYTVTWTMHDLDGDPLHASLFYSHDNGATWEPLAANLAAGVYPLDASLLPGGTQVWFRVLVTDGLRTTAATGGPITVPNKAPLVLVLGPKPRSVYGPGDAVLLRATAIDPEDGPLSPTGLAWSSDRDGPLGTGGDLIVRDLSLGWHTLTATATDSARVPGTATVRVFVGRQVFMPVMGVGR